MKEKVLFAAALMITLLAPIVLSADDSNALFQEIFQKAQAGDPEAQFSLGLMYQLGLGVPQDDKEAVKWHTRAAEQGDANAQYNLGVMYVRGDGVPEDYIVAYKWLNLAAAQGDQMAKDSRDALRKLMTPAQVAEAQGLSREFLERTEQNHR